MAILGRLSFSASSWSSRLDCWVEFSAWRFPQHKHSRRLQGIELGCQHRCRARPMVGKKLCSIDEDPEGRTCLRVVNILRSRGTRLIVSRSEPSAWCSDKPRASLRSAPRPILLRNGLCIGLRGLLRLTRGLTLESQRLCTVSISRTKMSTSRLRWQLDGARRYALDLRALVRRVQPQARYWTSPSQQGFRRALISAAASRRQKGLVALA